MEGKESWLPRVTSGSPWPTLSPEPSPAAAALGGFGVVPAV